MTGTRLAGTISPSPRWAFDSNRWQTVARKILMLAHVVPPMVLRVTETIWTIRTPARVRGDPTKTPDPFYRILKKSASGVLVSLRGSTYRSVRFASSLAAALLDSLFEHPDVILALAPYGKFQP